MTPRRPQECPDSFSPSLATQRTFPLALTLALALAQLLCSSPLKAAQDLAAVLDQALSSVVLVLATGDDGAVSQGSGFFITEDGVLVTNRHVLARSTSVVIKRPDGAFFEILGFVADDPTNDLVLLKAKGRGFNPLRLAASDAVSVGERVYAVGSPLALESSVSEGIVSAIRDLEEFGNVLQTTAAISPGSSGGALLNSRGEAIGVTTFLIRGGNSLHFARPVSEVSQLLSAASEPRPVRELGTLAPDPDAPEPAPKSASGGQSPSRSRASQPSRWMDLRSKDEWLIRSDERFSYWDYSPPMTLPNQAFVRCQLDTSQIPWIGECFARIPARCALSERWCDFEGPISVESPSPNRLEGHMDTPDGKPGCRCRFKVSRDAFVLVPK